MRIVITGASGFIGRRIVVALVAAGHSVVAVSRQPLPAGTRAEWRPSPDLGADADWSSILAGSDAVIHAAARVHVMDEQVRDPLSEFRLINVDGTVALARQAATAGVRRFIFLSTIKVNGETTTGRLPFGATDTPAPTDAYAISKWEAECRIADIGAATGMETASIRPVLVHGVGAKGNISTLATIAAGGWPLPFGAIRNRRSFVHVDNLADLVAHAVTFPKALPSVMLVTDGESLSTAELLRRLARGAGREARLPAVPLWLLAVGARLARRAAWSDRLLGSLEVDDTATRTALNWSPPISLDDGLARMAASFKSA